MGKLLLWIKSMGLGNLPVYASVSLGLQAGLQIVNSEKVSNKLGPVEVMAEEVSSSFSEPAQSFIKKSEDGSFLIGDRPISNLGSALENIKVASPAAPIVASVSTSSPARALASTASSSTSGVIGGSPRARPSTQSSSSAGSSSGPSSSSNNTSGSNGGSTSDAPSGLIAIAEASVSLDATELLEVKNAEAGTDLSSSESSGGEYSDPNPDPDPTSYISSSFAGTALNGNTVSTSSVVTAIDDTLYLVAVNYTDDSNFVASVSGLGLTWNQHSDQCSNQGTIKTELWYAYGITTVDEVVQVNLNSDSDSANMIVSVIKQADLAAPFSRSKSANPLGEDALATCGNPGTNSASYTYELDSIENDSFVFNAIGFSKDKTHSTSANEESLEVNSGGNPSKASNLAVSEESSSGAGLKSIGGDFSGGVRWSSISVEVKLLP